jgi:hypothetical protein
VDLSEPLATLDPADRPAAKAETSAAAAFAWLADPQPPPPPLELHQQIAREIADALGWPLEDTTAAITELHTYPNEEDTDA